MTVKTEQYQFSHGMKPVGWGNWDFLIGSKLEPGRILFAADEDWFLFNGNYSEAKKAAIAEAKRQGETCITVLP
jgi:hypothetical protein